MHVRRSIHNFRCTESEGIESVESTCSCPVARCPTLWVWDGLGFHGLEVPAGLWAPAEVVVLFQRLVLLTWRREAAERE